MRVTFGGALVVWLVTANAHAGGSDEPPVHAADAPSETPPEDSAKDPAEEAAEALFDEAVELAQRGRWAEARDRYQRSLDAKYAPETVYSLGVAQKETGAYVEALASFEKFLAAPATPEREPFRRAAQATVAELRRLIGRISVSLSEPARSDMVLSIDGDVLPLEEAIAGQPANPGHHTVKAVSDGRAARIITVQVNPGEHERVVLDFESPSPDRRPVAGWTLVGSGTGLLTAGLVTGVAGIVGASGTVRGTSRADEAHSMAIAGDVIAGVGALATGVGIYLLLDEAGEDEGDEVPVRAALRPAAGGLGLTVDF